MEKKDLCFWQNCLSPNAPWYADCSPTSWKLLLVSALCLRGSQNVTSRGCRRFFELGLRRIGWTTAFSQACAIYTEKCGLSPHQFN